MINTTRRRDAIADIQALFNVLAKLSRDELHGDTKAICSVSLKSLARLLELLERDQRRKLV